MATISPALTPTFEAILDGDADPIFADTEAEFQEAVEAVCGAGSPPTSKGFALQTGELPLSPSVVSVLSDPAAAAAVLPWVIIADFSNAELFPADMPLPNLRSLSLNSAAVSSPPDLSPFPHLLVLDLSFVSLDDDPAPSLASPSLRKLVVDDCDLTDASLTALVGALPSLELLSMADNAVEDPAAIASLAPRLPALSQLTANDNPAADCDTYKSTVTAAWPRLRRLDSASLIMTSSISGVAAVSSDIGVSYTPIGDSASCSCVEGNACLVPENCKDWANRFKVAEGVRKRNLSLPPALRK